MEVLPTGFDNVFDGPEGKNVPSRNDPRTTRSPLLRRQVRYPVCVYGWAGKR